MPTPSAAFMVSTMSAQASLMRGVISLTGLHFLASIDSPLTVIFLSAILFFFRLLIYIIPYGFTSISINAGALDAIMRSRKAMYSLT